jgi:AcrR family transcriptional regulator
MPRPRAAAVKSRGAAAPQIGKGSTSSPSARAAASPQRRKVTRLSAEERREQLLSTAAQILVTSGFDALTMEAIGLQSGASKTLGYVYFTNAEEIVLALWSRELGHLYSQVMREAEGTTDFASSVRAITEAYYEVVAERGVLLSTLQAGITAMRLDVSQEPETERFVGWLSEQVVKEFDVDPGLARHYALLSTSMAGMDAVSRAGQTRDREREARCLRFLTAGLEGALRDADEGAPEPKPRRLRGTARRRS